MEEDEENEILKNEMNMNDEGDSCDENSIRYHQNHDSQGFESSCQNKDSNGTTTADTSGVEKRKDNFVSKSCRKEFTIFIMCKHTESKQCK